MTYKFWDKDKTLRMLEDGLTPSELGKKCEVHHKTALQYLKKLQNVDPDIKHKKVGRGNIFWRDTLTYNEKSVHPEFLEIL